MICVGSSASEIAFPFLKSVEIIRPAAHDKGLIQPDAELISTVCLKPNTDICFSSRGVLARLA